MKTKVCTKCGRKLPQSEFGRLSSGYLRSWCKECCCEYTKKYTAENREKVKIIQQRYFQKRKEKTKTLAQREQLNKKREFERDVLGGYVVHILNYPFNKERKYNVVSTSGEVFKTNDKQEFLKFLEAI